MRKRHRDKESQASPGLAWGTLGLAGGYQVTLVVEVEETMQLGRVRLTSAEWEHLFQEGVYLYCVQPSHIIRLCPYWPKERAHGIQLAGYYGLEHPELGHGGPGGFWCRGLLHKPEAGITAGHPYSAPHHTPPGGVPQQGLIARVTHSTLLLLMTLSGNQSLCLNVISSPQTPLVLGLP